ncbi:hypothetical protein L6452_01540 [Arctium lappa]|uniref:Uncharacterized protein n=1 Tax=Arctium lappa TaxID=4217 RepID=A0ACB9FGD6_ARCLA|nr:hypothetical protein L6452_01540 [Arctium lappa]
MDLSDLNSFHPKESQPIEIKTSRFIPKSTTATVQPPGSGIQHKLYGDHHEDDDGSAKTSGLEKQSSRRLQTTMKRAFSIRRCSSVSEKYCRIHGHSVSPETTFFCHGEEDLQITGSANNQKKRSVLKACKRVFGFYFQRS